MKKANLTYSAKTLTNKMGKGAINFDCAVQRGLVWKGDKKSLLIHSMLTDYPIPPFYMVKNEDEECVEYDCLDGKQRSNAIYGFIHNEYSLDTDIPTVTNEEGEEEDFSGMGFDALPEWAQDKIKDYNLLVYYFEDITEAEVHEMFRRLNNGKPLTATELTRVKAVSLPQFQTIAKHKAVQAATTEKGKATFKDEQIAMQLYAMKHMEDLDFSTKEFRPFIETAMVTDEQMDDINNGLDMVSNLLDMLGAEGKDNKENTRVQRKVKSRTHFVSVSYLATLCAASGVAQEDFNEAVYDFFKTTATTASNDYNGTVGAGSARADAVRKRKGCMDAMASNLIAKTVTNL